MIESNRELTLSLRRCACILSLSIPKLMASVKGFEGYSGSTRKCSDGAEKDENENNSDINGKYSIPNCIAVLKRLRKEFYSMNKLEYGFALESIKDPQNRIIIMSLQDSMTELYCWNHYNYTVNERQNLR
ncbi:hypothetical protein DEO72_LG3g2257 [Vigna unguiculata]|uniref:Uncharacterized protein n=1 Tax=Vigna unguiculata TaxID=3917 RepID=A0A4D6LGK2_VIGUN|nr:hypothetical protein DEO72_LG3g2257 [Vigna unguiculata]